MNDPSEEFVDIVNKANEVIGKATRGEAHQKGLIHRALSVLVIHSGGKLLLQQRSKHTKVHPLSWDLSTSEHLLAGETYEMAGQRSVREELGVEVIVTPVSKTSLQKRKYQLKKKAVYENEIVMMLSATHDGPFNIDPVEVNKVEFFTVEAIEKMITDGVQFTPWFLDEWENVKRVLAQSSLRGAK